MLVLSSEPKFQLLPKLVSRDLSEQDRPGPAPLKHSPQDCCPPARVEFPPQRVSSPSNPFPVESHIPASKYFWFFWLPSPTRDIQSPCQATEHFCPLACLKEVSAPPLNVMHFLLNSLSSPSWGSLVLIWSPAVSYKIKGAKFQERHRSSSSKPTIHSFNIVIFLLNISYFWYQFSKLLTY